MLSFSGAGRPLVALFLGLALILSLALPASCASENQVEVRVVKRGMVDLDTSSVEPGEYSAVVEYGFNVWNGRDESRKSIRELKMIIKPRNPDAIREMHQENLELVSREPIIGVGRNVGEDQGIDLGMRTSVKEKVEVPLKISRIVDVSYFEETGEQVATLVVVPTSSEISEMSVSIEFGEEWSGDDAKVSFVSASREHFEREWDGRAQFHVQNPAEGQEYHFVVQLEVSPLDGKVTYLPNVWLSAVMKSRTLKSAEGKSYQQEIELGSFRIESSEEVVFNPRVEEEVAVSLKGVSTGAKLLDVKIPFLSKEEEALKPSGEEETLSVGKEEPSSIVLPMGQPIASISREGGLYGVDWEFVGVFLVVVGTVAGTVVTWVKGRRKRGIVSRYIRQIDVKYTDPEAGPAEKRDALKKMKRKISEEFGRGKLDESAYSILDKRIDDYLKEQRDSAGISNVELKAEIDKILEDGIVTKEEYAEFEDMLNKGYELKKGEKEELKKRVKEIREESEKKGF